MKCIIVICSQGLGRSLQRQAGVLNQVDHANILHEAMHHDIFKKPPQGLAKGFDILAPFSGSGSPNAFGVKGERLECCAPDANEFLVPKRFASKRCRTLRE